MYLLYSLLGALALVALSPYFLLRDMRRGKRGHSLVQRMGRLPQGFGALPKGGIWLHAVSVGEVLAAAPLAARLKKLRPEMPLFISTVTDTGQAIARERIPCADGFFYFPLDFAGMMRRVLRALAPAAVIIVETEIWPNLLRQADRARVPVIFVNARISDRSFRQYRLTNRFLNNFIGDALHHAALFLAQSEKDAQRLRELGAEESRVFVAGNLKFDLQPPPVGPLTAWLETQLRAQERWPVVVAGSVAADEEEAVLAAYDLVQRRWRHALLVLAPRKPQRWDAAAEIVAEDGWKAVRRSKLTLAEPLAEDADAILLDTIGELAGIYGLADAVFVGGSLVPVGGHNLLEPAFFSRPPVFGPYMDSFREMAAQFLAAGAGIQVRDGEELGRAWVRLIEDRPLREQMGDAARQLIERSRGATDVMATRILETIAAGGSTAASSADAWAAPMPANAREHESLGDDRKQGSE
jgi:3-deoxy-D-manno-octulosonic-acid transferase